MRLNTFNLIEKDMFFLNEKFLKYGTIASGDYFNREKIVIAVFLNPTQSEWIKNVPQGARGYIGRAGLYIEGHDDLKENPLSLIAHDALMKIIKLPYKMYHGFDEDDEGLFVQRLGKTNTLRMAESYGFRREYAKEKAFPFKAFLVKKCPYLKLQGVEPNGRNWDRDTDRKRIGFNLWKDRDKEDSYN
jgi:hypothetical protein